MEHALVRRDVALHDDPLRSQSLAMVVGALVAVVVVAACAAVAFLRPRGDLGSTQVVVARETGAMYVRIDDVWHPTPNLASARLIVRAAAVPTLVDQRALDGVRRGPAVGIVGAPATLDADPPPDTWTVCDGRDTLVAADRGLSPADRFDPGRSVLVTPRGESAALTFLLFDGRRARVDLRNPAVVRALRLDGISPQPVSRALLDTVPEVAPIVVPGIDGAGSVGPMGATVGSVVQVVGAAAADLYVVLADGVQRIGEVAADLIGITYAGTALGVPTVSPAAIAATRLVDRLQVDHLPDRARTPATGGVVCVRWRAGVPDVSTQPVVSVGAHLDVGDAVTLAQADGAGPRIDRVALPAGRASYVHAARILGDEAAGPRYLVADDGVVYGVHDDTAATALGLTEPPAGAPWPILAWLPRGPELSIAGAGAVRDGLAAPAP
ncbi:type VII secretion protein EccB [Mycolicibacterium sediminis]